MFLEEWRMHSRFLEGRRIGAMPLLIAAVTFGGLELVQGLTTTSTQGMGLMVSAFGFFSGLAAASTVFSRKDASRNVLKDKTFLVYSSRVLPTRSKGLAAAFFVKNALFYFLLYLLPFAAASVSSSPALLIYAALVFPLFLIGQLLGIFLAGRGLGFSVRKIMDYHDLRGSPLKRKFFLDLYRSSGGLLKVLLSTSALLGLYLYAANYVPLADYLLVRPMLSFSVVLGLSTVTVYNWLNTYDSLSEYSFLEIDESAVLRDKFSVFKYISLGLVAVFVPLFYLLQGGDLLLGLVLAGSVAYYTGAVTFYFAGIRPNENMVDGWRSAAFLVMVNVFIIPLLGYSALDTGSGLFLQASGLMILIGLLLEKLRKK